MDEKQPAYTLRPVVKPVRKARAPEPGEEERVEVRAAYEAVFLRAENEDDDGYDPFSDRPPAPEPTFEADPWD